jgi:hypothetical protein
VIAQLATEIADAIGADTLFSESRQLADLSYVTIPVLSVVDSDLASKVDRAAQLGALVTVAIKSAKCKWVENKGPYYTDIEIELRAEERVSLNRGSVEAPSEYGSRVSALSMIERAVAVAHHLIPQSLSCPLLTHGWDEELTGNNDHQVYIGRITTQGGLTYTLPQIATPAITDNAGTLTLTCATAGAAIFYTTDGRNPVPRSGTLYTAPFAPGAGKTVKAKAWLAGYQASEVSLITT